MRHTQTPGSTYTASSGLQRGLLRRENPDNHVTILKLSNGSSDFLPPGAQPKESRYSEIFLDNFTVS